MDLNSVGPLTYIFLKIVNIIALLGLLSGSVVRNPPVSTGNEDLIAISGRFPRERNGYSLQVYC